MGRARRRMVGDLFGELWELFMEHPLLGGLLIAGVLGLYWFALPYLRDKMGGLSREAYMGLKIAITLVALGLLFLLRMVL